jgi:hypothetical protein
MMPPADADLSAGPGSAGAFEVALFESENANCVGKTREYQPRRGDMQ